MSDGLLIQDSTGKVLQFNQAALSALGHTEDQLLGLTSMDPEWKAIREDGTDFPGQEHPAMVSLRTGKKVVGVVMGIQLPSGTQRWFRINSTLYESKGDTTHNQAAGRHVLTTFIDITASKQMEVGLRQSEEKYRGLFEEAPLGVAVIDSNTGRIYDVNPAYAKMMGRTKDEMLKINWMSITHPDDVQEDLDLMAIMNSRGTNGFQMEKRYIHADQSVVWVSMTISKIKVEDPASPRHLCMVKDITKRRNVERETESVNLRYSNLVDAINKSAIVAVTNVSGAIIEVNEIFCKISGYSQDELIGSNHRILNSNIHPPEFFKTMWQTISKGQIWRAEICNKRKDGSLYWVDTSINKMTGQNGETQYLAIKSDITARKEAETKLIQSSRLAALGEMSAGIAHEINNPLAIIAVSTILLDKFKNDPVKFTSKVATIEKAIERISQIVGGLKRFSRCSEGISYDNHSLSAIVRESLILTLMKSQRHNTSVTGDFKTESLIHCNEIQIEQVVINLINNSIDAVKGRDEKWVKILLFEEGLAVVIRVMDSGPGIPENVRAKLFDPFFTTKKVGEGTGLGLSITKGILDEHNATITVVADRPNTCFEIRFPKAEEIKNVT
jgi:PAS domain S-box-containing protein